MSQGFWTGTWEEALEQADPALLAECMGYIETLELLGGDRFTLARMQHPAGSEQSRVMLALGILDAMEIALSRTNIEESCSYFENVLQPMFFHKYWPITGDQCIVDYIYASMCQHVRYRFEPELPQMVFFDGTASTGWEMRVPVPGYSPEGWKLFEPSAQNKAHYILVCTTSSTGTCAVKMTTVSRGHTTLLSNRISRVVSEDEAMRIATVYADRYGFRQYMMPLSMATVEFAKILPRYIRAPGQAWAPPNG
jgi:hypothetical protein